MQPSSETRIATYGFFFDDVAWQMRTLPSVSKKEHCSAESAADRVSSESVPSDAGEQEQSSPSAPQTISARFMRTPMSSRLGATPTWDQFGYGGVRRPATPGRRPNA